MEGENSIEKKGIDNVSKRNKIKRRAFLASLLGVPSLLAFEDKVGKFTSEGLLSGQYTINELISNLDSIKDYQYKVDAILISIIDSDSAMYFYKNIRNLKNYFSKQEINDILYRLLEKVIYLSIQIEGSVFNNNHFEHIRDFLIDPEDYFKKLQIIKEEGPYGVSNNLDLFYGLSFYKDFYDYCLRYYKQYQFVYGDNLLLYAKVSKYPDLMAIQRENFKKDDDSVFANIIYNISNFKDYTDLHDFISKLLIKNIKISINFLRYANYLPNYKYILEKAFVYIKTSGVYKTSSLFFDNYDLFKDFPDAHLLLLDSIESNSVFSFDAGRLNFINIDTLPYDVKIQIIKSRVNRVNLFVFANFNKFYSDSRLQTELDDFMNRFDGRIASVLIDHFSIIFLKYKKISSSLIELLNSIPTKDLIHISIKEPYNEVIDQILQRRIQKKDIPLDVKSYVRLCAKYKFIEKLILENNDRLFWREVFVTIASYGYKSSFFKKFVDDFIDYISILNDNDKDSDYYTTSVFRFEGYLRSFKNKKIDKFIDELIIKTKKNKKNKSVFISPCNKNFDQLVMSSILEDGKEVICNNNSVSVLVKMYYLNREYRQDIINYLKNHSYLLLNSLKFLANLPDDIFVLLLEHCFNNKMNDFRSNFALIIEYINFIPVNKITDNKFREFVDFVVEVKTNSTNVFIVTHLFLALYENKIKFDLNEFKTKSNDVKYLFLKSMEIPKGDIYYDYVVKQNSLLFVHKINEDHNLEYEKRFAPLKDLSVEYLILLIKFGYQEAYPSTIDGLFDSLFKKVKNDKIKLIDVFDSISSADFRKIFSLIISKKRVKEVSDLLGSNDFEKVLDAYVKNLDQDQDILLGAISIADALIETDDDYLLNMIQSRLIDSFNNAKNKELKILYGLLLSSFNNKKPNLAKEETKQISTKFKIPLLNKIDSGRIFVSGVNKQRYFFYDDEDGIKSFGSFISRYHQNKSWKITEKDSYVKIESLGSFNNKIEIYANKPKAKNGNSDIDKLNHNFQFSVHRGHIYHQSKSLDLMQKDQSFVFLGSCAGYNDVVSVLTKSPNASIISTQRTGTSDINDPILFSINNHLLRNKDIIWPDLWAGVERQLKGNNLFKFYVPPHKNNGVLFAKAYDSLLNESI